MLVNLQRTLILPQKPVARTAVSSHVSFIDGILMIRLEFEFSCLLRFVERNTRRTAHTDTCYDEVHRWSIRQQAVYHSYERCNQVNETILLINPSDELWASIKRQLGDSTPSSRVDEGWAVMPNIVFESLTANWTAYVSCLHKAVEQIVCDHAPHL